MVSFIVGKGLTALPQDPVRHAGLPRCLAGGNAGFWRRVFAGGPFLRPVCCHLAGTSNATNVPPTTGAPLSCRKVKLERLWREFFSDPSGWWDHRPEKTNPRFPDFKHKTKQQSLWLRNKLTPSWVEAELAAIAPGTIQSSIFSWNTRLRTYVKAGEYRKTIDLFQQMQRESMTPDKFSFVPVLNACSRLSALEEGRSIHLHIIKSGFETDVYVGSCLVDMYAKCGRIEDARRIFNKMPTKDVVSWGALILGYVKCGQGLEALQLSRLMEQEGMHLNSVTLVGVLNASASIGALDEGKRAHEKIIDRGYEYDIYVANSLVDMYAKCGSIEDARTVFDKTSTRDVVSYSALILGYVKCGQGQEALELFQLMQREGLDLTPLIFVGVLNACASIGALDEGKCAHEQIIYRGYEYDVHVANSLIDMYAKCGSIEDARTVFNKIPAKDVVSYNALILGYVRFGQGQEALALSRQMQQEGFVPDPCTFVGVLNACASIGAIEEGRHAHGQIMCRGYEGDIYVANSLVDMYARCGSVEDAGAVFNKMLTKDVVSYNALILGYVKCGKGQEALRLSRLMQQEGVVMNPVTFVGVLKACASIGALDEGKRAHELIIGKGYECDVYVANSLVDMYAKCGSIQDARGVFNKLPRRDVVSFNTVILGYAKCGQGQEALELFGLMQQEGVGLSSVTFIGVLNACASIGALEEGRRAHGQIINRGYECDIHVANSLVDMYAKCGSLGDAQKVFNEMPTRNVVSWGAMLAGYCSYGYAKEALEHFGKMCQEVQVDAVSFIALLSACSHGGFVDEGIGIFESMSVVFNISPTVEHYACVIDLLGRAGHLHEGEDLIGKMPCEPDASVWMSLVGACRLHGNVEIGELATKQLLLLDPGNAAGFVLLSNIYADTGQWDSMHSVHLQGM